MRLAAFRPWVLSVTLAIGGCYEAHGLDEVAPSDGATRDASALDARIADGAIDAPGLDATLSDAALPDAFFARPDAALPDAFFARPDAALPDAFFARPDAALPDAALPPTSRALRFTAEQVMTVPDRPALSIGPDLTLELWARLRSPGVIVIKGDPRVAYHLYLELLPSPDGALRTFRFGFAGEGRAPFEIDRPIARDTWTHFALVQRARPRGRLEVELFIDGESASGGPLVYATVDDYLTTFNTQPLLFGRMDMDLDEVRLWRVPRTLATLRAFMRRELPPRASGLAAYWPLGGVGQVVLDRSLGGNDGFRGTMTDEDRADPTWIPDGAF